MPGAGPPQAPVSPAPFCPCPPKPRALHQGEQVSDGHLSPSPFRAPSCESTPPGGAPCSHLPRRFSQACPWGWVLMPLLQHQEVTTLGALTGDQRLHLGRDRKMCPAGALTCLTSRVSSGRELRAKDEDKEEEQVGDRRAPSERSSRCWRGVSEGPWLCSLPGALVPFLLLPFLLLPGRLGPQPHPEIHCCRPATEGFCPFQPTASFPKARHSVYSSKLEVLVAVRESAAVNFKMIKCICAVCVDGLLLTPRLSVWATLGSIREGLMHQLSIFKWGPTRLGSL